MSTVPTLDIVILSISFLFFFIYSLWFNYQTTYSSSVWGSQLGRNLETMTMWGQKHSEHGDPATVTLAVQTLRNGLIVAIFVGGAALSSSAAMLNTFDNTHRLTPLSVPMMIRSGLISSLLMLSFLNWTLVIRYNNHSGFIIGALEMHLRTIENKAKRVVKKQQRQSQEKWGREQEREPEREDEGVAVIAALNKNISDRECPGHGTHTFLHTHDPPNGLLRHAIITMEEEKDDTDTDTDTDTETEHLLEEPEMVTQLKRNLRLVALHFSWGFRFIFFSIPYFFYAGGVYPLIVSYVITMLFLFYFDDPVMTVPSSRDMYLFKSSHGGEKEMMWADTHKQSRVLRTKMPQEGVLDMK